MSDELKPCPFCGGEAATISGKPNPRTGRRPYCWRVYCADCQSRTFTFKTRRRAVAVWNGRHCPNAPDGERTCRWSLDRERYTHPWVVWRSRCGKEHVTFAPEVAVAVNIPFPKFCDNCGGKIVEGS